MKRVKAAILKSSLAAVAMLAAASSASAATVTYSTTNLTEMQHQYAYTWQINGISGITGTITGARLTFFNFYNWTTAANDPNNILWVDLLDTARTYDANGIASMQDNTNSGTLGLSDVLDGFRYSGGNNLSVVGSSGLVTSGTAKNYVGSSTNSADSTVTGYNAAGSSLGSNSGAFGTTPTTWTLDFSSASITALAAYIANGQNIAIGLDADCHFYDSKIQLDIFYTPGGGGGAAVPEPATLLLVGSGLATAAYRRRKAAQTK